MSRILICVAALLVSACTTTAPRSALVSPDALDITELGTAMARGETSSEATTRAYLSRIAAIDDDGPTLNAVIATMPDALDQARLLDAERRAGRVRGPMHGVPVLVKDNIEVAGPLPTTAGSLALANNVTNRDAPLVARLRAAGAVILGKTNLSEWANIRSNESTSGWSAVGGLVRNPHALDRNACGSSSGSGAAMAARLAAATIGTETDGSIMCPAGTNGVVGFKPTLGLVSRTYVVPISHSQDTAGPMTGSVMDAAIMLAAIAGSDPADPATSEADSRKRDYVAVLSPDWFKGKRIGVLRDRLGERPEILAIVDSATDALRAAGAIVVDIAESRKGLDGLGDAEFEVLMTELKADMGAYLRSLPDTASGGGDPRSLADLIAFNKTRAGEELRWFDQDLFELGESKPGLDAKAYRDALAKSKRLAGPEGIDRLLATHKVDLLMGVTNGPAWVTDLVNGDNFSGPGSSQLPAIAGYPHLTVPGATIEGLPIGISFFGAKWKDADVLAAGYAFERVWRPRPVPGYRATVTTPVTE